METPISQQLENMIQAAKSDVTDASRALDEAIINDPTLSHKQRMVLIHLQAAARKQNLIIENIGVHLDYLDSRIDIIMNHLKNQ